MNYGSEPADQVVRYSLEGAEFALRISGTAAKTSLFCASRAARQQKDPRQNPPHSAFERTETAEIFTVDKDRMHDFARAAKAHGLLFCPIRDKMDPDHIEIAILQDDASKANRIIENCSWMSWTPARQNWSMLCSRIWKMQPPTTRTRPPWISSGLGERQSVRAFLRQQQIFCKLAVAARRSASSQG